MEIVQSFLAKDILKVLDDAINACETLRDEESKEFDKNYYRGKIDAYYYIKGLIDSELMGEIEIEKK